MLKTNIFFRPDTAKIIVGTILKKNYDIDTEVLTEKRYEYYIDKYKFTSRFPGRCELLISEICRQLEIKCSDDFTAVLEGVYNYFKSKQQSMINISSGIRTYIYFVQVHPKEEKMIQSKSTFSIDMVMNTFYKNTLVTNTPKISPTSLINFLSLASFKNTKEMLGISNSGIGWYNIDSNKIQSYNDTKEFTNSKLRIISHLEETCTNFINNLSHLFKILGLVLTDDIKESRYTLNIPQHQPSKMVDHANGIQHDYQFNINLISAVCTAYLENMNDMKDAWIGYVDRKIIKRSGKPITKDIHISDHFNIFSNSIDLVQICEKIIWYCTSHTVPKIIEYKCFNNFVQHV